MNNWQKEQGAVLVEMILTLPLILLFMLGMAQLALFFQKQMQLDYACFKANRSAIVHSHQEGWLEKAKTEANQVMKEKMTSLSVQSNVKFMAPIKNYVNDFQENFLKEEVEISWENETDEIKIGTPIHLLLEYTYPFKFLMTKKMFRSITGASGIRLKSQCTLVSESGPF